MKTAIATILGTAALGFLKGKLGSNARKSSIQIIKCDEIKLDYRLRLYTSIIDLEHIQTGWSASKFINQMDIVDISIKCVGSHIDDDIPQEIIEEYGDYFYAYFDIYVKLKGRFENDLEPANKGKTFQLILDTVKELWVENILSLAPDAETEVQTNDFKSYDSIDRFIDEYNEIDDIIEGFYGSRTSVLDSFYVADKEGNPIGPKLDKDTTKLRIR